MKEEKNKKQQKKKERGRRRRGEEEEEKDKEEEEGEEEPSRRKKRKKTRVCRRAKLCGGVARQVRQQQQSGAAAKRRHQAWHRAWQGGWWWQGSLSKLSLSPSLFSYLLLTLGRKGLRGMERQEVLHQAAGYCDLCAATCMGGGVGNTFASEALALRGWCPGKRTSLRSALHGLGLGTTEALLPLPGPRSAQGHGDATEGRVVFTCQLR
jgi:hypothetical protein